MHEVSMMSEKKVLLVWNEKAEWVMDGETGEMEIISRDVR